MKNIIYSLALALTLWSCVTYQKCKEKYLIDTTSNNGVKKIIIDKKLPVKGEVKSGGVDLEDLISEGITDTSGQSVLAVYVVDTIRLHDTVKVVKWKVKIKDREVPVHDTIYVPYTCPPTNNFKDQGILQKIIENFKWWWLILLAIMISSIGYFISAVKK